MKDAKLKVKCRGLMGGVAVGEALVSKQPFGFWGELDPYTGIVTDVHHEWCGKCVAGKILVFPAGRGSTGSGGIFVQAFKSGKSPAAIVTVEEMDLALLSGPLSVEAFYGVKIPVVDKPEADILGLVSTGDTVKVDGDRGLITITKETKPS
jgi:hypothetical protein